MRSHPFMQRSAASIAEDHHSMVLPFSSGSRTCQTNRSPGRWSPCKALPLQTLPAEISRFLAEGGKSRGRLLVRSLQKLRDMPPPGALARMFVDLACAPELWSEVS